MGVTLPTAAAPPGLRLYVIGDVHGRVDLLRRLHADIADDLMRRPCARFRIVLLGDLIDRGPDSRAVVALTQEMVQDGDAVALAGNHEHFMLAFLEGRPGGAAWPDAGGDKTLASYGVDPTLARRSIDATRDALAAALPVAHLAFLRAMPLIETQGDYLFVHAGIRPRRPLSWQSARDLTTIREPFLSHRRPHAKVVVHGHTPGDTPVVRSNRIGLDTRAYASNVLTCLVLEGADRAFLGPCGRMPVACADAVP